MKAIKSIKRNSAVFFRVMMILCLTLSIASLTSCQSELDYEEPKTTPKPVTPTDPDHNFNIESDLFESHFEAEANMNLALGVDTMLSVVSLKKTVDGKPVDGEGETYSKKPIFKAEVKSVSNEIKKIDSYELVFDEFFLKPEQPQSINVGGYYDTREVWLGSYTVNGQKQNIRLDNQRFSKFFSENEPVLDMPHSPVDSANVGTYRVVEKSEEKFIKDGVECHLVTFGVTTKIFRGKEMSRKVMTKSSGSNSAYTNNIEMMVQFYVPADEVPPVEPTIDEMTGYSNVRKSYTIDLTNSVVIAKIEFTAHWSVSGKRDSTIVENFPFNYSAPAERVFTNSANNTVTYKDFENVLNDVVSGNRTKYTLDTHYDYYHNNNIYNSKFVFKYETGFVTILGDVVWFSTPEPHQSFNGVPQISEVPVEVDGKIVTTTTFEMRNAIVFGDKNLSNKHLIKVVNSKDKPTDPDPETNDLISVVEKDKGYVINDNGTIKYFINYSIEREITGKKDTTVFVNKNWSLETPGMLDFTQDEFGLTYVTTTPSEVVNGLKHTNTNTYSFRLKDGQSFDLAFVGKYEDGGSVTLFAGTEFERTVDFVKVTMAQAFDQFTPGNKVIEGSFEKLPYTVGNKIVFGNKNMSNSSVVNVKVEDKVHPIYGRLIGYKGRTKSACNQVAAKLWNVDLYEWENGFTIKADGVETGKFWLRSELSASVIANLVSATSKDGGTWTPSEMSSDTKQDYMFWTATFASGQQVQSNFPYKLYNMKPSDFYIATTWKFVGDYLIVYDASGREIDRQARR